MKKKHAPKKPYGGMETRKEELAEQAVPMGYANGGLVKGSMYACEAPNKPVGTHGPGVRSQQDYRK